MSVYIKQNTELIAAQFKDFLKQRNWTQVKRLIQQNPSVECLYNDLLASRYNKIKSDMDLQELINELFIDYYFENNIECFRLVTTLGVTADPYITILLELNDKEKNITDELITSLIYNSEPIEFEYTPKEMENTLLNRELNYNPKKIYIDWDYQNSYGRTLLMVSMVYTERLYFLMEDKIEKTNINLIDKNGLTLLIYCVLFCGVKDIFDQTLSRNQNINHISNFGSTALYYACKVDIDYKVEELLKAGANPDIGKNGLYPILAVSSKEVLDLLIKYKVNPNVVDSHDDTVLMLMLAKNDDLAITLIEYYKTNVNYENVGGITPLILLISKCENNKLLKLLLSRPDIDVNYVTKNSETALIIAAIFNCLYACELLVNHPKINKNYKNEFGKTAKSIAEKIKINITNAKSIEDVYKLNPKRKYDLGYLVTDVTPEEAFRKIRKWNDDNAKILKLLS